MSIDIHFIFGRGAINWISVSVHQCQLISHFILGRGAINWISIGYIMTLFFLVHLASLILLIKLTFSFETH